MIINLENQSQAKNKNLSTTFITLAQLQRNYHKTAEVYKSALYLMICDSYRK